jgi:hypothetical protein
MPFRYLKDPLFLMCFAAYGIQRCLKSFDLSTPFLCSYLNDLICIPFWVPIMLWGNKKLGLRRNDDPPEGFEIIIPLILWAFVFEVLIPGMPSWSIPTWADPCDILSYCVGGLAAALFWKVYYRESPLTTQEKH